MDRLGFIGAGNMGMAMLKGYLNSQEGSKTKISVHDRNPSKEQELKELGVSFYKDITELVKSNQYIIIATKPQQADDVFLNISNVISPENVIISICAGLPIKKIEEALGEKTKIVQVMPNTPMFLGLGASAVAKNENVTDEEFSFVRSILNSSGISEIIPHDKMNEIISINGSSPAFIYLFAKCFSTYAAEQGIDNKSALNLFAQSLIGAGEMLMSSGMTPDELIKQVSSKGGTTVAGLDSLCNNGLENIVKSACEACTKRAYELSEM